jgi:uncharacterized protein (TIGR02757 family)
MHPLKKTLDTFYGEYNFKERVKHDPIEIPRRYSRPDDIEIAGFFASSLAYGKIGLFKPVIERILKPGGRHPACFFKDFHLGRDKKYLQGISYRFNKEEDILCLVYMISHTLKKWGSLKNIFYHYYEPGHEDIKYALEKLVNYFMNIDTSPIYGKNIRPYGLKQFFPSPESGSACKRLNLFLRWMVRTKDIDLGIWNKIPPSKLIIPLDTHIARISRCLDLTKRKSSDWKTAREITDELKQMNPGDPLKYDFALCHQGISGLCRGERFRSVCSSCAILGHLWP